MICLTPAGETIYPNVSTYIPPRSQCNTSTVFPTGYPIPIERPSIPPYATLLTVMGVIAFLFMLSVLLYRKCRSTAMIT